MTDEPKAELKPNPARYTDDLVILLIVIGYFVAPHFGMNVADWILSAALAYVFGREVPSKL